MQKKWIYTITSVLSAIALLIGPMAAGAHQNVTLKNASGGTVASNVPYSPKVTCGGCHFKCSDSSYSTDQATWCDGTAGKLQKDCSVPGSCPDYASAVTSESSHIQGYTNSAKLVSFQTYSVTAPAHGASTGLHSTHGRNETLTAAQRTIWGNPALIGGTGMYGRY
jgi:hypothetical protein